jgi:hypothetical protein
MKRSLLGMLATLAVALLPGARTASAQDINFASHSEIMSVLERQNQRIAELEAGQHHGGGAGGCSSCGDSCCDIGCGSCCDPCCRPGGVIGGAEISFLKFHESLGTGGPGSGTALHTDIDPDYDTAYRLWAGYQGSDGLGWRVRYWEYDHSYSAANAALPGLLTDSFGVDTYVLDLEFIDSMNLGCNWDASWFGGFRYLEFEHIRTRSTLLGVTTAYEEFDTAAWGLTFGGELRRCIGNGLAGFVNARSSVLYGDESEYGLGGLVDDELNNIYFMYEAQAGVQWTRELEQGGYLFARAATEVQYWDNFVGEVGVDGGEAVGFGGLSFSAGIIR